MNNFISFSHSKLKDLLLEPPLFYNNDVGIRFELGVPYRGDIGDKYNSNYFDIVNKRAIELFEFTFNDCKKLYIVCKGFEPLPPFEVINPGLNLFSNYLYNKCLDQVECYEEVPDIDEDTQKLCGYSRSYVLYCSLSELDYKGALKAISFADFTSKGDYISDRVYFIHPTKNIVMHMYDDRGMDIVAPDKETLIDMYMRYNAWILDYDRQRIDKIFSG